MDFHVKSPRKRFDFTGVKDGASMWVASKSEAVNVVRAFTAWAKESGKLLTAIDERVGPTDPGGKGYRVHFEERVDPAAKAVGTLDGWFVERTKPTKHPPRGGWHFMSTLHGDYEKWFDDAGLPANHFLSMSRFSQLLAARPEVTRTRTADGSIVMSMALKDAEIFVIPKHTTVNGVVEYAPPEPAPTSWDDVAPQPEPVEPPEQAETSPRERWVVEGEGPPPELASYYREEDDDSPDAFDDAEIKCPLCDVKFPADAADDDGNCPKCAAA